MTPFAVLERACCAHQHGKRFGRRGHACGTKAKAVTRSATQIRGPERCRGVRHRRQSIGVASSSSCALGECMHGEQHSFARLQVRGVSGSPSDTILPQHSCIVSSSCRRMGDSQPLSDVCGKQKARPACVLCKRMQGEQHSKAVFHAAHSFTNSLCVQEIVLHGSVVPG